MRWPQRDPPVEPVEAPLGDPQGAPTEEPLEVGMEFSPHPNPGAARGRRDEVTPARGGYRGEEGGGMNWTREMNLKEAQISALEKEVARLKAQSRVSRASTLFEEDDP